MHLIGQQLKEARLKKQLNRDELANLTGLKEETIADIEEGKMDTQISTLYKISDVLKCSFVIGDMSI
ncbi:MAG TPA: helix-turn-helix transcriptional regulator [Bacillales bacterium]|nr:helix-turn-helix transcriptional regulator [Bacillales bacterium]